MKKTLVTDPVNKYKMIRPQYNRGSVNIEIPPASFIHVANSKPYAVVWTNRLMLIKIAQTNTY